MDLSKYRAMFVTEAQEHLRQMSSGVLGLEQNPADAERIQGLFRNAHSIKGMAASMGYEAVATLSHRLEDLMDRYRAGDRTVESPAIDLLLEGVDALTHHVQAIAEEKPPALDLEPLATKVQAFLDGRNGGGGVPGGKALLSVIVRISKQAQAARVRAFMVHRRLSELGTIVASVPSAADLRAGQGEFDGALKAALKTTEPAEAVRKAVAGLAEVESVAVESAAAGASAVQPVRPAPPAPAAPGAGTRVRVPRTVKVQTDLLDSFVNQAGELLVVESRLKALTRDLELPPVKDATATLGTLIRGLHAQIMTVRMMPLSTVSEALPRVVRDLAKREGKEVALVQEGTDLELDRGLLEELPDLLTHVLRNAVDHGLEAASDREAAGKPRRGQIRLRAFRQKDKAVVQIEDDGRGMNPARLKAKALEKGQITPERAAAMTDAEVLYLCALPGLSTAEKVTDVSGRGVGMDAVKTRVEGLGGSLQIESRVGHGTRISLHLPTSVAIVQVLLLGIDDEVFAIPVTRVLRTLEITPAEIEQRGRQLFFRFEEESVPLLSLRKILRLPARETRGRLLSVAVVRVRQRTVGLVVDRFVGQQEAFIKPLPRPLASIDGVAGVTILGDGRAIFLLDSENLF